MANDNPNVGAVVIGRNEGERLLNCLDSLKGKVEEIIYVDSGSIDNSIIDSQKRGVDCISLDLSTPFTAARARNEGARHLVNSRPGIAYIQFIDGDCEIDYQWIDEAVQFLNNNNKYAAVCGRLRERFPQHSIYNQLMDIEWNTPIGDAPACGGIAMIRISAFNQVNGFRDALIAGEEPEMCFRMRARGWGIYRLDVEMAKHDAAMTTFAQWWNRNTRAGYAYAASCYLHGRSDEHFRVKDVIRIIVWAIVVPGLIVLLTLKNIVFSVLVVIYPLQVLRLAIKYKVLIKSWKIALTQALFVVIAKFPQFAGMVKFARNKIKGAEERLIEYK